MGKWLMLAAILAPLVAHADPPRLPNLSLNAPLDGRLYPPTTTYRTFTPLLPTSSAVAASEGWGFRATLHGRTLDLAHTDLGWAPDSQVQSGDMSAGWGWRGHGAEAVVGYDQYAVGPHFDPRAHPRQDFGGAGQSAHTSVLGLSLVLRGP